MKLTIMILVASIVALLAVLIVCRLQEVFSHKSKIQTASGKHYRVRFKKLNVIERMFIPFGSAMRWLFAPRGVPFGSRLVAANIAEGTHSESFTKLTDAAIATRHLLYRRGSDDNHIAASAASDALCPIGTVDDEASAAEELVAVQILGKGSTKRMVASEAITIGDEVWTAAGGKVQDRTAVAGTYWIVGTALSAAGADGDIIEVADCTPIRITIP